MKVWLVSIVFFVFFPNILMGAPVDISLWRHQANDVEMKASLEAIQRFNDSQSKWHVVTDLIPEASYTLSITAAAQAEVLPCVIEIDQPLVPNFAWHGFIRPLKGLVDDEVLSLINTSGKGIYKGEVYSVGPLDVSLALFTRKSLIKELGLRQPTIDQPWNKAEFMSALDAIKATGRYQYPFDMRAQDRTEWIPYAWAPLMMSWGADLIDRNNYQTVQSFLNSKEAIGFGYWIQHLVKGKYINANPKDDNGFINGEIGIQYGGSWSLTSYYNAFKDDLAVLPVPDFGHGAVVGGGSWHWAISSDCKHSEAAKELITFLVSEKEQVSMSNVIGIFPTNPNAANLIDNYSEYGKWRMLYDYSNRFAVLRPETPAYSVISSSYKKAMSDILNNMPPPVALELAVENIKAAFERHKNYIAP